MNKVILMGNLGKAPEVKQTTNGQTLMTFSIATNEPERQQDGSWGTRAEWHNCILWGERCEKLAPHLDKGSKIAVEGKLQTRTWQADDGTERRTTEIKVFDIEFAEGKRPADGQQGRPANRPTPNRAPRQSPAGTRNYRQQDTSFDYGANAPDYNPDLDPNVDPFAQYK